MSSTAPKPERNKNKGNIYIFIGLFLFLSGSILMLLIRYGKVLGIHISGGSIGLYAALILMTFIGIKMMTSGRKLKTLDAEEIIAKGERPIVLYLRSFALDEIDGQNKIPMPGGLSEPVNPWEGGLANAFGKVADMIAIGRPGETLATTGASRLYVNDDEWQDKVLEMIDTSEFIIWTYGSSEGLKWEITRLVDIVPPEKLILAIPFWDKRIKQRKEIWDEAKKRLSPIFKKPLPEFSGVSLLMTFDKEWNGTWIESKNDNSLFLKCITLGFYSQIAKGVKSLLISRGYVYPPLSPTEKITYTVLGLCGWTVLAVLCVMLYGLFVTFTK